MRYVSYMLNKVGKYLTDSSGAIAVMFTMMVPILIGVAGLSLDMSRSFLVKQRLLQALDAAALAAAATSTDASEIEKRVQDFVAANYPADKIGAVFVPSVTISGDDIIVSGTAIYYTVFMRVLGITQIDVVAETTVVREVQGIEVVLVMDNTGSMNSNNNISALRAAASNFVYIMHGIDTDDGDAASVSSLDTMSTRDSEFIKIGLVPYSTSVNLGKYALGMYPDDSYYSAPFVNNPNDLSYATATYGSGWMGCVLAHDYPDDTLDHEGPWDMYRYCRDANDDPYCHLKRNGDVRRGPNYNCVKTPLTPLSTSPSELKESIDTMRAYGYTYGNYGMVWGGRLLSPEFPFEEGVPWVNEYWRKAVVMMTDGVNTMHRRYSLYGPTQDHNIRPRDLNDRFVEVCDDLKSKGVIIYTVTFYSGVSESTKDYYRQCATSERYYHDAPGQQDLIDVFEEIGRELSNLHIKN